MSSDELAIILFWLTLVAGMVVETVKAENLTRRIGFGSTAGLFLLLAIFWQQLQHRWPAFTALVDSVANNPQTWFFIAVLAYAAISFWSPKRQSERLAIDARLREARAEIDQLRTQIDQARSAAPDSDEIAREIEALRRKLEVTAASLPQLEWEIKDAATAAATHGQSAEQLMAQGKVTSDALISLRSGHAWLKKTFIQLLDALDARDVQSRFKENDEIVWRLGLKLLKTNPPQYNSSDAWMNDYRPWRDSLLAIDAAAGALGNKNRPFLDITPSELEACLEMPPNVIAEDGNTIVPYKTVFLAFRQYERYREKVAQFFEMKAKLPASSNIP